MPGQAGLAGLPVTVWTLANPFVTIMLVPARSHAPVCRRDRQAKPPLTREGIITVALRLLRAEGLLSRRLPRSAQPAS